MSLQPPASVDDLGLQGALNLWALLTGQERRLPITPTARMTLTVMDLLRQQRIIEVPWPSASWGLIPEAQHTPLEDLQWRLAWKVYDPPQLLAALEDYLGNIPKDDLGMAIRLRLWIELGAGEAEHFFASQLEKHGLPTEWAQDIAFVYQTHKHRLSFAHWRYCAWAAVRKGASLAMRGFSSSEQLREAIYQELRHRASAVANGAWTQCSLPPFHPTPPSALARGFIHLLSPLGMAYWTTCPSLDALAEAGR